MGSKTDTQRSEQIGIRLSQQERRLVEAAAAKDQRRMSDWVRIVILRAVRRSVGRVA